jgi:hypothetical protein
VADLDEVQMEYVDDLTNILTLVEERGVAGAARVLGVSDRTVRRWLRNKARLKSISAFSL